ncbi:bifunctional tetrahydrofolate synthase/dihydrofolate synthase [Porticoccus litoralis]|jgi:dihydrofolate synthase/folylpolyglutamate synthase|uniref:Dihydrofolate synthase/folylpolyglutamate synthase n=1 Tax=Porticoccus litoralis TaxID=434086 RepID=A0AAW8B192_9GAMM|nr:bifunctional tetrahydrofolate synthase/dihydrofolate synthase [Porticoccus litoralis]MDP1519395.1 bifunctional tetrahydrofolate synthase/dihydrofolate synthase [Porticoccus litoralis]TNE84489.1 MAG: bifunctional tetrahydrofolate synthase/dihydrofolate synthase [Gammaproteobacteria bacterium]
MLPRSLSEWLGLLQQRHPTEIELGLSRVGRVARDLQCLSPAKNTVTITGTNGKGSCVAALQALLMDQGYRVGCYTSPHLIDYNERIVIQGEQASDEAICQAFQRIEEARGDTSLTYFEFGTLAALILMSEAELDVAILEVGLGGRLDAVNIVDAGIAIVTSIALDHQDWLGDDLDRIGAEKAAIARPGRPLLCGDDFPVEGIVRTAADIGATLLVNDRDFSLGQFQSVPDHRLPANSVACALQATHMITGLPASDISTQPLSLVQVPGRFQEASVAGVPVILDVAHNPQAAGLLAERLVPQKGRLLAVVGMMADKDIIGTLQPMIPLVRAWFPCSIPEQLRAATEGNIEALLYNAGAAANGEVYCCSSPLSAFEKALQHAGEGDRVVVFGSFFTVGPILEHIQSS